MCILPSDFLAFPYKNYLDVAINLLIFLPSYAKKRRVTVCLEYVHLYRTRSHLTDINK